MLPAPSATSAIYFDDGNGDNLFCGGWRFFRLPELGLDDGPRAFEWHERPDFGLDLTTRTAENCLWEFTTGVATVYVCVDLSTWLD